MAPSSSTSSSDRRLPTGPAGTLLGSLRRTSTWLLLGILVAAAWLRADGLGFGLPAVYNPDEVAILSRALAFAKGDLNPHNFLYPTLFFYVLAAWIGGYFVLAWVGGSIASLEAFQTHFFVDPSNVYLAGRTLGVVTGVLGVLATWWLARRLFGRSIATVAALFLAAGPTAVRDAHYIKHDVPVTLAIVVAMIAIARVWPLGSRPHDAGRPGRPTAPATAALAGLACGVAISTHYYAVFLGAPLVLAIWWTDGPAAAGRAKTFAVSAVAALIAFFVCSPFLLVEPVTAWRDIVANRQIVVDRSGAGSGVLFASATAYLRMLWTEGLGWPVLLLAGAGVWLTVGLSWRVAAWLLSFTLLFLAFISNTVPAGRYLNPVLPFVAVLAAAGAQDLAVRLVPRRKVAGLAVLAGLAMLPGLAASRHLDWFLHQDDTRTLAARFIEANVPAGRTVLVQPYSVQLVQSREGLLEALEARIGDPSRASTKFALRLKLDPWPSPAYRTLYLGDGGLDADKIYVGYGDLLEPEPSAVLDRLGVEYVVLKRYNVENSVMRPLVAALEREWHRLASFSPYRADATAATQAEVAPFQHNTDVPLHEALERPGPVIEIWTVE